MCSINSVKNPDLVQIAKCPNSNFRVISLIDKFFLLGIVSGVLGGVGLGSYLWLSFSGFLNITPNFLFIRKLHALLQINLFLGSFILGFCLHAAPKLIGSRNFANSLSILFIPSLVIGFIFSMIWPDSVIGSFLLSVPFAIVAAFILRMSFSAATRGNFWLAYPLVYGLLVLAFIPFSDLINPQKNLNLFLLSIMQIIFATGQQFITGILSGRRLPLLFAVSVLLINILIGFLYIVDLDQNYKALVSTCICMEFIIYIWGTGSHRAFKTWKNSGFALSVAAGNLWLIVSALMFVFNLVPAAYILHTLALGYALPITIVTSCRIMAALSGLPVINDKNLFTLIAFWQIVPLSRLVHFVYPNASLVSLIFLITVVVLILVWSWVISKAIIKMNS